MKVVLLLVIFFVILQWSGATPLPKCTDHQCIRQKDSPHLCNRQKNFDYYNELDRTKRGTTFKNFTKAISNAAHKVGKTLHIIRKRSGGESVDDFNKTTLTIDEENLLGDISGNTTNVQVKRETHHKPTQNNTHHAAHPKREARCSTNETALEEQKKSKRQTENLESIEFKNNLTNNFVNETHEALNSTIVKRMLNDQDILVSAGSEISSNNTRRRRQDETAATNETEVTQNTTRTTRQNQLLSTLDSVQNETEDTRNFDNVTSTHIHTIIGRASNDTEFLPSNANQSIEDSLRYKRNFTEDLSNNSTLHQNNSSKIYNKTDVLIKHTEDSSSNSTYHKYEDSPEIDLATNKIEEAENSTETQIESTTETKVKREDKENGVHLLVNREVEQNITENLNITEPEEHAIRNRSIFENSTENEEKVKRSALNKHHECDEFVRSVRAVVNNDTQVSKNYTDLANSTLKIARSTHNHTNSTTNSSEISRKTRSTNEDTNFIRKFGLRVRKAAQKEPPKADGPRSPEGRVLKPGHFFLPPSYYGGLGAKAQYSPKYLGYPPGMPTFAPIPKDDVKREADPEQYLSRQKRAINFIQDDDVKPTPEPMRNDQQYYHYDILEDDLEAIQANQVDAPPSRNVQRVGCACAMYLNDEVTNKKSPFISETVLEVPNEKDSSDKELLCTKACTETAKIYFRMKEDVYCAHIKNNVESKDLKNPQMKKYPWEESDMILCQVFSDDNEPSIQYVLSWLNVVLLDLVVCLTGLGIVCTYLICFIGWRRREAVAYSSATFSVK